MVVMGKIHLLFKKEEIDEEKLAEGHKVAVVLDVLFATSTIVTSLSIGAKDVIPVLNQEEALQMASQLEERSYYLMGEDKGKLIDGFFDPNPLKLTEKIQDKTLILSTTNGTVAICKAMQAKKVYIAALLNGKAVAKRIVESHKADTIIVICSGSHQHFCLEDFYGAGYLIDELVALFDGWKLSDAAKLAVSFYQDNKESAKEVLEGSRLGEKLIQNGFKEEIDYISQCGVLSIVPYLHHGKLTVEGNEMQREMMI